MVFTRGMHYVRADTGVGGGSRPVSFANCSLWQ